MFTITVTIPRVDVHVHQCSDPAIVSRLDGLAEGIAQLKVQVGGLMAVSEAVRAVVTRLDAATNELAADLKDLRDKIAAGTPLTPEDVAEFDRVTAALEAMGRDPENPVPEPEPA